ncbi:diaminopimelate epimerase [soil metagenome]
MQLSFTKMNGAGNDFVMLDNRSASLSLDTAQIAHLCDRHRGVGADGVLIVEPPQNGADFRMRYYNADGGEAEMCGNGARCFGRYASRLAGGDRPEISFETMAGTIGATFQGDNVRIAMSDPHSYRPAQEIEVDGRILEVHFLNTGVPHAVVFVDNVEDVDVVRNGAALRYHDAFAPKGTNANFVQVLGPGSLVLRTYERGVEGETLACGTGVCAAAILYHLKSQAPSPISVKVRGGDTLRVGFEKTDEGFRNVTLTGPADFVFDGTVSL